MWTAYLGQHKITVSESLIMLIKYLTSGRYSARTRPDAFGLYGLYGQGSCVNMPEALVGVAWRSAPDVGLMDPTATPAVSQPDGQCNPGEKYAKYPLL